MLLNTALASLVLQEKDLLFNPVPLIHPVFKIFPFQPNKQLFHNPLSHDQKQEKALADFLTPYMAF